MNETKLWLDVSGAATRNVIVYLWYVNILYKFIFITFCVSYIKSHLRKGNS